MITFTVAADAFSDQGNVETSKDIGVSTSFPDADAEEPTELFAGADYRAIGLTVSPNRIIVSRGNDMYFFDFDGTLQTAETLSIGPSGLLEYFNDTLILTRNNLQPNRFPINSITSLGLLPLDNDNESTVPTAHGWLQTRGTSPFYLLPYGGSGSDITEIARPSGLVVKNLMAHQGGLLFMASNRTGSRVFSLAEITDAETITFHRRLNLGGGLTFADIDDIAVSRDTLYIAEEGSGTSGTIHTVDIRKYRPMLLNTKTRIDVQFIDEGGSLDTKRLCPDAENVIVFATGFDKPTYLSINATNELEVASSAVTETTPVLVRLTGINRIDSQDFSFYLVIRQAANPTVRDIDELAMYASTTFNLFDIVNNATAITFRTGQTQPTGSSISSGVFTIGTAGGTAYFTATNANGSTNFEIAIDVVSVDADNFSDTFRYRTEIAGIDVSADVKGTPTVSESIDEVRLNVVTANRVNLTLRSDSTNGFKFNGGLADNFWDANSLNADGFQEPIKVYIESLISGSYVRSLLFSGRIHEPAASISEAEVRISAVDISTRLRNALVSDFGTLTKWDALKQQSDAVNYEGVNIPESSLLPIQLGTGTAWSDRTKLDISRLPLSSEGPVESNTGYLTTQDFRTAGGFLASLPVLRFKTEHRAEDVRFLIKQAAINKDIYQTQIDIPAIQRDTPFILNRGSVPFSVEDTRITRLPVDWVHDSTNDRVLNLLSNPESHIADLLVQYSLDSDTYRSLHTFDTDIKAHRIERRTATNYYILTSAPITQDRSAADLPRTVDKTAYAFDSAAVGSAVKICAYNTNTGVLTAHVEETDTYPPQLGNSLLRIL